MTDEDRRWVHLMWRVLAVLGILALLWVLATEVQ
jgi:hypothetical protein